MNLKSAIDGFLGNVKKSQSPNTYKNYKSDLLGQAGFLAILAPHGIRPSSLASTLNENMAVQFLQDLMDKGYSKSTRTRKAAAVRAFYGFIAGLELAPITIDKLDYKIKAGKLLTGAKVNIQFDADKIERILKYAAKFSPPSSSKKHPNKTLVFLRNKAFLFTLAETGLRVSEACRLTVADINREQHSAVIIGKGDKQAPVYWGRQSWEFLNEYLYLRAGTNWQALNSPVFIRLDKNAGKTPKPITPVTGEEIVHDWAKAALGSDYDVDITAHKFRHWFVTKVYSETGDIKIAQEQARHSNIGTTERYTHISSKKNRQIHTDIFG